MDIFTLRGTSIYKMNWEIINGYVGGGKLFLTNCKRFYNDLNNGYVHNKNIIDKIVFMKSLFDVLPTELQREIYLYDSTFHEKFSMVQNELEKKIDIASSCGYQFPKNCIEYQLQKIYRTNIIFSYDNRVRKQTNHCTCYFCVSDRI